MAIATVQELYQEGEAFNEQGITCKRPSIEPMDPDLVMAYESLPARLSTQDDAHIAGAVLKGLADYAKAVTKAFDPHTQAAHRLHTFLTGLRSLAVRTIVERQDRVKKLLLEYDEEQRRLAAEQARLEAEARRAELEAQRAELEAQALEQARQMADSGQAEEAAEMINQTVAALDEQIAAPMVIPPAAPARVAGFSRRDNWKHNVTDLMSLVKAVAQGQAPLDCLCANDRFLAQQARAFKKASPFPGVRFYNDPTGVVR